MKQSEIKELSVVDLESKLAEMRLSYSSLKLSHAISPLENPIQLRNIRRVIARVSTELRKRNS